MPVQRVKVASAKDAPRSGAHKDFAFAGEGDDLVKVLVSNVDGTLFATSAKCTHYGAPLANGVLTAAGKLVCPWHGACFDAKTGDIEDAPALDSLVSLKVETDKEGNVFVEADAEQLKGKPGVSPRCDVGGKESKAAGTVIIGGGSASINCAESARKVSGVAFVAAVQPCLLTMTVRRATRTPSPSSLRKSMHQSTEPSCPRGW